MRRSTARSGRIRTRTQILIRTTLTKTSTSDTSSSNTARLGVAYELIDPLPVARADRPLLLRVRVHNTGAEAWAYRGAHPVTLSYHWLDVRGQVVDFEGVRTTL